MSHPIATPWMLGQTRLRTRVVKTATFEGMTPTGRVTPALIDHHAALARHQVGLTTVAYGAVHPDGRTFPAQLLIDEACVPGLTRLAEAVHAEGGAASLQLAHCGGFSKEGPDDGRAPAGPSAAFNAYGLMHGVPRIRSFGADELSGVVSSFARAARHAQRAGFDAVEVHAGHGYLLSQFLSPALNRRRDAWGGSLEGRARLAVEVVQAVRAEVGSQLPILVKINTRDGLEGGLEVGDSVRVAQWLVQAGADAIVPSGGLVQRTPFFLLRGDTPLRQMIEAETHALQRWALRLFAPLWIRSHAYTPAYFWEDATRFVDALDVPVGLLGGVEGAGACTAALGRGFTFVVMGRALLADPDLVARLAEGEPAETRCTHCNQCIPEADRGGVRCVLDGDAG